VNFLLDTDMLSLIARDASKALAQRVDGVSPDALGISVVTRGEAEFGLAKHRPKRSTLERMRLLLATLPTLPLTERAVPHFIAVRAELERRGTPIGVNDLWIAAHALADALTLVTHNEREFARVPGLKIENWLR
jgi:tRNA(fMet)-specific endonuclease VapC